MNPQTWQTALNPTLLLNALGGTKRKQVIAAQPIRKRILPEQISELLLVCQTLFFTFHLRMDGKASDICDKNY